MLLFFFLCCFCFFKSSVITSADLHYASSSPDPYCVIGQKTTEFGVRRCGLECQILFLLHVPSWTKHNLSEPLFFSTPVTYLDILCMKSHYKYHLLQVIRLVCFHTILVVFHIIYKSCIKMLVLTNAAGTEEWRIRDHVGQGRDLNGI